MKPMPKSKTPVLSTWKKKTSFKSNIPQLEIKLDQILEQEEIGLKPKRVQISFNKKQDRPSSYQISPIHYHQFQKIAIKKVELENKSFGEGIYKLQQFPKKPSIGYVSDTSSKYHSIKSSSQQTPIKRIEYLRDLGNSNNQRKKSISSIKSISAKDSVEFQEKLRHRREDSLESMNNILGKVQCEKTGRQSQFSVRQYVKNVYQAPYSPDRQIKTISQTAAFTSFSRANVPSPFNSNQKGHSQSMHQDKNKSLPNYIQTFSATPHYIKQESRQKLDQISQKQQSRKQLSHYSMTKKKINQLKNKFKKQLTNEQFVKSNYPYVSSFLQNQTQKQQHQDSNVFDRLYNQKANQIRRKSGSKNAPKKQSSSIKGSSKHSKKSSSKIYLPPSQQNIEPVFSFDQYSLTQIRQSTDFIKEKSSAHQIRNPNIRISSESKSDARQMLYQKFGSGFSQFIPQVFRFCIGCQQPILEANIINHERTCGDLRRLYDNDLSQLKDYLNSKINRMKQQIQAQTLKPSQQNMKQQVQTMKKGINQWLKKSIKKKIPDRQYQQLYQTVKKNCNLGIFKTMENVKKVDWFLRVRGRVQQALFQTNYLCTAIQQQNRII